MKGITDERALWLSRYVLPHEPALRAWLGHRRVANLDVDDIVQETYAKLAALDSVDGIRHPKNYVYQTAYSLIVSHVRRSRVVSILTIGDVSELNTATLQPSPEREIEDRDELQKLAEALAGLSPVCRAVLIFRRVDGLSQREIAARLRLSESAVERHMTKAIHFLMDHFGRGGKSRSRASIRGDMSSLAANDRTGIKSKD